MNTFLVIMLMVVINEKNVISSQCLFDNHVKMYIFFPIPKSILTELLINIYIDDRNKNPRFPHLTVQRHLVEFARWAAMWRINIS